MLLCPHVLPSQPQLITASHVVPWQCTPPSEHLRRFTHCCFQEVEKLYSAQLGIVANAADLFAVASFS